MKKALALLLGLLMLAVLAAGCAPEPTPPADDISMDAAGVGESIDESIDENGSYTGAEEVALYLRRYGHLPGNFITKDEAEALGWEGGSLEEVAPGKSIGGDYFGNYEGLLPTAKGRRYTECDIDTEGAESRGAKRLVYSNDGLIYYSDDHYESFTQLYGEDEDA